MLSYERALMGAGGLKPEPIYIEDVFSTHLYAGTGSTQTITNGIDLAGEGGLLWLKKRSAAASHYLADTVRGNTKTIRTNGATGEVTNSVPISSFNSDGFTVGGDSEINSILGHTMASWTFRKAAKFFDVVTYTGDGTFPRSINHNLGSVPGCVLIKCTSHAADWMVWHRGLNTTQPSQDYLVLNTTAAKSQGNYIFYSSQGQLSSTQFGGFGPYDEVNLSGRTYVAYLFAHDAGGFGDSGNESVVKCGSFTTDGSGNATVNLGWEPQWLLWKASSAAQNWYVHDNMRGLGTFVASTLYPNLSNAEANYNAININSTGFTCSDNANRTYIYIAIRRGPMKTPTDATKVFNIIARTGTGAAATITGVGFPTDLVGTKARSVGDGCVFRDRLRGTPASLLTFSTGAETTATDAITSFNMDGISLGTDATEGRTNTNAVTYANWFFRRAPGFFDVVTYTGDGDASTTTVPHGLTVQPELMIFKRRNGASSWDTYVPSNATNYYLVRLSDTGAQLVGNVLRTNASSSTLLKVGWLSGNVNGINDVGYTYIAYLFASCPGVSKVGSYTGTGTTLSIDCGFTSGARLVLIKRTDSTGDWYVWDTARGIVAADDPFLLLNSTASENTGTDHIDPLSSGFQISSTAPAAINANGGSFIFLAVA